MTAMPTNNLESCQLHLFTYILLHFITIIKRLQELLIAVLAAAIVGIIRMHSFGAKMSRVRRGLIRRLRPSATTVCALCARTLSHTHRIQRVSISHDVTGVMLGQSRNSGDHTPRRPMKMGNEFQNGRPQASLSLSYTHTHTQFRHDDDDDNETTADSENPKTTTK